MIHSSWLLGYNFVWVPRQSSRECIPKRCKYHVRTVKPSCKNIMKNKEHHSMQRPSGAMWKWSVIYCLSFSHPQDKQIAHPRSQPLVCRWPRPSYFSDQASEWQNRFAGIKRKGEHVWKCTNYWGCMELSWSKRLSKHQLSCAFTSDGFNVSRDPLIYRVVPNIVPPVPPYVHPILPSSQPIT